MTQKTYPSETWKQHLNKNSHSIRCIKGALPLTTAILASNLVLSTTRNINLTYGHQTTATQNSNKVVLDISFHPTAVTELLIKENKSASKTLN
jgi:hypothetical protein